LRDNIGIGALDRISTAGVIDRKRDHALTRDVVQLLGIYTGYRIKDHDDTTAAELSGGNQQKTLIGREIAGEPEVILIDEPTKGVDVGAKYDIHAIIRAMAAKGAGCLLVSSDLPEVLALAARILVMREGRLRGEVTTETSGAAAGDGRGSKEESVMRLAATSEAVA